MYDTILFPTNGGKASERAAEDAVELAETHDATLHVLYVVDEKVYTAYSGDEYVHDSEGLETGLRQEGEEAVNAVAEGAREHGVDVTTIVRDGVPHEEIIEYNEEIGADLLVMGTKDRPGEYRQLLGSVTERVLRTTSTPLVVVKTPVEE